MKNATPEGKLPMAKTSLPDELAAVSVEIDWTVFQKHMPNILYCRCGGIWYSHDKFIMSHGKVVPEHPCPSCNRFDRVFRSEGPTEELVIGGRSSTQV